MISFQTSWGTFHQLVHEEEHACHVSITISIFSHSHFLFPPTPPFPETIPMKLNFSLNSLLFITRELLSCPIHHWVCRYYLWFTNSFVYYGLTLNSGRWIFISMSEYLFHVKTICCQKYISRVVIYINLGVLCNDVITPQNLYLNEIYQTYVRIYWSQNDFHSAFSLEVCT